MGGVILRLMKKTPEAYALETKRFIDENKITYKLAEMREILSRILTAIWGLMIWTISKEHWRKLSSGRSRVINIMAMIPPNVRAAAFSARHFRACRKVYKKSTHPSA